MLVLILQAQLKELELNTQLDITDVNATATNYLAIQVALSATTQRIWGGVVTIAAQ